LENLDLFINKCCGLILCSECGIKGNHIGKYGGKLRGSCGNCSAQIDMEKNMMFISRDFDLKKVYQGIDENNISIDISAEQVKKLPGKVENVEEVKKVNPKLVAMLNIILGNRIEKAPESAPEPINEPMQETPYNEIIPDKKEDKTVMQKIKDSNNGTFKNSNNDSVIYIPEMNEKNKFKGSIKHLVEGLDSHSIPQDPAKPKKIIIFNNYEESINMIIDFLNENKVKFIYYGGNYRNMAELINQFKTTDIPVIIINSSITCAGINIQIATDVIFFHKIKDENIEGQVAGRAQRIGRTCDLNIHYLLYENEKI